MFKGSQSRKFSYRTAATQRDTSSVVCKSTFIGNMAVEQGRVRGAFCPALNIMGTDQMLQHLSLYDQMRFQGFKIKITPIPKDTTVNTMFYYRWYRDNVPLGEPKIMGTNDNGYRFPSGYIPAILLEVDERC